MSDDQLDGEDVLEKVQSVYPQMGKDCAEEWRDALEEEYGVPVHSLSVAMQAGNGHDQIMIDSPFYSSECGDLYHILGHIASLVRFTVNNSDADPSYIFEQAEKVYHEPDGIESVEDLE